MNKKVPKKEQWFDVKIECQLPATLTFRVLAEDANQAAEKIRHMQPTGVKYKLVGRRDVKLTVYDAGSSIIRFVKNIIGIR